MKQLVYGGILSTIFLASLTALWPIQTGFSQANELELESCPSCNGGVRYHHHHFVYCTTVDSEDVLPTSIGGTEKRAMHYHHIHCR